MRSSIDGSIEIEVPAATAYEFWTRVEEFPRFIGPVERVVRIDEKRTRWHANFGFRRQEWTAEITEIIPDRRRAWRAGRRLQLGHGQLPPDLRRPDLDDPAPGLRAPGHAAELSGTRWAS